MGRQKVPRRWFRGRCVFGLVHQVTQKQIGHAPAYQPWCDARVDRPFKWKMTRTRDAATCLECVMLGAQFGR